MTAARAATVLGTLADLCEQQAYALESDRAPAIALLSDRILVALAELDTADFVVLQQYVASDPQCRREATRLMANHAQTQVLLPLAIERVARRRTRLSRAGIEWYGGKTVRRSRRGDLDVSA